MSELIIMYIGGVLMGYLTFPLLLNICLDLYKEINGIKKISIKKRRHLK
jgi:hypothetical protein